MGKGGDKELESCGYGMAEPRSFELERTKRVREERKRRANHCKVGEKSKQEEHLPFSPSVSPVATSPYVEGTKAVYFLCRSPMSDKPLRGGDKVKAEGTKSQKAKPVP
jgi:hypothetical protein